MTIGVAAVITMFALGTGAQQTVSQDVQSAGTKLIYSSRRATLPAAAKSRTSRAAWVRPTRLTQDDAEAIGQIPGVKYVAGQVKLRGWAQTSGERVLHAGHRHRDVLRPDERLVISPTAIFLRQRTCRRLHRSPCSAHRCGTVSLATRIRWAARSRFTDQTFRIVGVFTTTDEDQADMVFVPYTTLQKALGMQSLHSITVSASRPAMRPASPADQDLAPAASPSGDASFRRAVA